MLSGFIVFSVRALKCKALFHLTKLLPEDVLMTYPKDVLRTSPYGATCNTRGRLETHRQRNVIVTYSGRQFSCELSGLRKFWPTESPLKMMKNDFYFTLKALFVLKIFIILSWLSDHVGKWLDQKDKVNFKVYDVRTWETNNWDRHFAQHLRK